MKTVIEMAREAGAIVLDGSDTTVIERFAELVRADEREACAKACESFQQDPYEERLYRSDFAEAIRARGQA